MVNALNSTTSAIGSIDLINTASFSWILTFIIFVSIVIFLFFVNIYFRRFIIGLTITLLLLIIGFISRFIGVSTSTGDFEPLKWFVYIILFFIISTILGYFITKNKKLNKIVNKLIE